MVARNERGSAASPTNKEGRRANHVNKMKFFHANFRPFFRAAVAAPRPAGGGFFAGCGLRPHPPPCGRGGYVLTTQGVALWGNDVDGYGSISARKSYPPYCVIIALCGRVGL